MEILVFAAVLCLATASSGDNSTASNGRGMANINGHDYFISDSERYTWPDAQAACADRGMQLVTFTTEDKNMDIMNYLRQNGLGLTSHWSGGHKVPSGQFEWAVLNEPFTYTWWANEQPDDPSDEAYVNFNTLDGWFDMPASYPLRIHFICE